MPTPPTLLAPELPLPSQPRKSHAGLIVAAVAGGVLLVAAATGGTLLATRDGSAAPKHTITYTITVERGDDDTCSDNGGYSDIESGATSEAVDGKGTLLGTGVLSTEFSGGATCKYGATFDVKKSTDGFYRVTAGNNNRGYLTRQESDFDKAGKLEIDASLGKV